MLSYIYVGHFDSTDKVYIGQSTDPQNRWARHIAELTKSKHHSSKLQRYFSEVDSDLHFDILDKTTSDKINDLEIYYISEFDSYNNGFNCTAGGEAFGSGYLAVGATGEKEQYEECIKLLAYTTASIEEISKETGLSKYVVSNISSGRRHGWLKEAFDLEYLIIESKGIRNSTDKDKIVRAAKYLYNNPKISLVSASSILNTSTKSLYHIVYGTAYKWLAEVIPIEYTALLNRHGKNRNT